MSALKKYEKWRKKTAAKSKVYSSITEIYLDFGGNLQNLISELQLVLDENQEKYTKNHISILK